MAAGIRFFMGGTASVPSHFAGYRLGAGDAGLSFAPPEAGADCPAVADGAAEGCTVVAGDGAAEDGAAAAAEEGVVAGETLAEGFAEDSGEAELAGLVEVCGDPDGTGEAAVEGVTAGVALCTSLSRIPTRRAALCLAVRTVKSNVTPKKIQPR
jgi:hypothetical protein